LSAPDVRDAVARIRDLPTLPSVLSKILATAADPDASALDLGKHIAADQSLSATLLRLVNSAYYGFYRQIKSVTQAIVVLGFLEVRNLTLTATAFRTLDQSNSDYDRLQLWRHSLATAMAAERCSKWLKLDAEGSFEAGLLHDIGKVVLDLLYPDKFRDAAHKAHEEERYIADVERELWNVDHAEIGGILGEHWNLPPGVVAAIRYHHVPEQCKEEPILTYLTAIGNYVSYQVGLGEWSNGRAPEYPAFAAEKLKLSQEQCTEIGEEIKRNIPKIDELLGALRKK
jgi:putative nucleotidyltransferase with HDIG domain